MLTAGNDVAVIAMNQAHGRVHRVDAGYAIGMNGLDDRIATRPPGESKQEDHDERGHNDPHPRRL